jgi:uncharacterized protein YlxW (UPF0749 family)
MNGGQMMVVLIVAIVMIAGIVKARYNYRLGSSEGEDQAPGDSRENQRLREEVTALKERLAVLERITIEKENSLEREIEQLRDR